MIRSSPACSSSSRELCPTSSNVSLSREPWKRSIRTRSSSSGSLVTTAPPSPNAPRFLLGKNENVEIVPSAPARRPSAAIEPAACAASSSTGTPSASISATGATLPNRWTTMTAFVRGVSAARTVSGGDAERLRVDVAEHRPRAGRRDRLGRRVERERRHHDLVARPDAHRLQRQRQRVGAVGHADRVARAEVARRSPPRSPRPPGRGCSGPRRAARRASRAGARAAARAVWRCRREGLPLQEYRLLADTVVVEGPGQRVIRRKIVFTSQSLRSVVRPGDLAVREQRLDDVVHQMDLKGSLDDGNAPELERRIDAALAGGVRWLIVDLAEANPVGDAGAQRALERRARAALPPRRADPRRRRARRRAAHQRLRGRPPPRAGRQRRPGDHDPQDAAARRRPCRGPSSASPR